MNPLPDDLNRGVHLLHRWKAVRPGAHWLGVHTDKMQEEGLCREILTPIGIGLILSARGREYIDKDNKVLSETVVANALYQQDALPTIQALGYETILPGAKNYRNVTEGTLRHPMIGRFTGKGYSQKTVQAHYQRLEPDLMVRRAYLIVLHPFPETIRPMPKLVTVFSEPRWQ